jgi:general secretion pathway protein L
MASYSQELKLFGFDLRALGAAFLRPWQDLYRGSLSAWLTPVVSLRLLRAGGLEMVCRPDKPCNGAGPLGGQKQFMAVEMPEEFVLRRRLSVPVLSDREVSEALALEIKSISPFSPDDLVWGYTVERMGNGSLRAESALASRRQVERHIAAFDGRLGAAPEVWVLAHNQMPIVLQGFGETARYRHAARGRRITLSLLGGVVCILAAIAITPTMQIRLRAIEAVDAFAVLQQRSHDLVQQREALVKGREALASLEAIVGDHADPLVVLDMLTQALPDEAYLQMIQIQGRKVTISGQADNAASLMTRLAANPGVRDVKAPGAATRPLGALKETFSIEFTVPPSSAVAASATNMVEAQVLAEGGRAASRQSAIAAGAQAPGGEPATKGGAPPAGAESFLTVTAPADSPQIPAASSSAVTPAGSGGGFSIGGSTSSRKSP